MYFFIRLHFLPIFFAVAERIRIERGDAAGYWQIWNLTILRDDTPIKFEIVNATPPLSVSKVEYITDNNPNTRYIAWCEDGCFIEIQVGRDVSLKALTFSWSQDAAILRAITAGNTPCDESCANAGMPVVQWSHPRLARLSCPSVDVSCGDHFAANCAECAALHGAYWCNGDCSWQGNSCLPQSGRNSSALGRRRRCSSATECQIDIACEGEDVGEPIRCQNGVWNADKEELRDPTERCVRAHSRWRVLAEGAVRFHEVSFRKRGCIGEIPTYPGRDGVAFGHGRLSHIRRVFDGISETYHLAPTTHPFVEFRFRGSVEDCKEIQCAVIETSPYKGSLSVQKLTKNGWESVLRSAPSPQYQIRRALVAMDPLSTPNDTAIVCE